VIASVMANPNLHVDRDLDLSNASRGVWLVKVCTDMMLGIVCGKFICVLKSITNEPRKLTREGICLFPEECSCRQYCL
jgi:hypothetical protein